VNNTTPCRASASRNGQSNVRAHRRSRLRAGRAFCWRRIVSSAARNRMACRPEVECGFRADAADKVIQSAFRGTDLRSVSGACAQALRSVSASSTGVMCCGPPTPVPNPKINSPPFNPASPGFAGCILQIAPALAAYAQCDQMIHPARVLPLSERLVDFACGEGFPRLENFRKRVSRQRPDQNVNVVRHHDKMSERISFAVKMPESGDHFPAAAVAAAHTNPRPYPASSQSDCQIFS